MEIFTQKKNASIDLLQDEEKARKSSQEKLVYLICGSITALVVLLSLGLFTYNLILKLTINSSQKEYAEKSTAWQAFSSVADDLKAISAKDQVLSQTSVKYANLDQKIDHLRMLVPENVTLTNFAINDQGLITISGKATSAANVYQFFDILSKDKSIVAPSLDALTKTGGAYNFSVTLTIKTD